MLRYLTQREPEPVRLDARGSHRRDGQEITYREVRQGDPPRSIFQPSEGGTGAGARSSGNFQGLCSRRGSPAGRPLRIIMSLQAGADQFENLFVEGEPG